MDLAIAGVTEREAGGSGYTVYLTPLEAINQSVIFGETDLGESLTGSPESTDRFSEILRVIGESALISSQPTPPPKQHKTLKDALILEAHIRAGRNIFVTDDAATFIEFGKRQTLQSKFAVRIMTGAEFLDACRSGNL